MSPLDPVLLEVLACPCEHHAPVRVDGEPGRPDRRSRRAHVAVLVGRLAIEVADLDFVEIEALPPAAEDHFLADGRADCRNASSSRLTSAGCSCCTQWPAPSITRQR